MSSGSTTFHACRTDSRKNVAARVRLPLLGETRFADDAASDVMSVAIALFYVLGLLWVAVCLATPGGHWPIG